MRGRSPAPGPTASSERGWEGRRSSGFTVLELLIVVAIIGLLAAIAVVSMVSAIDRARQRKTMADIYNVGLALQMYRNDFAAFPVADGDVADIRAALEPTYLKQLPAQDGWNEPLLYSSDGGAYTVLSFGGNRASDTPYSPGPTKSFGDDIVFKDGSFYQWPEGMQHGGGGGAAQE